MHLCPTSMIEQGGLKGMSKAPVSVRDRLSLTREESLVGKSVSTPIKSREGHLQWKKARAPEAAFYLLQMGATQSSIPTPLDCFPKNWDKFDPQSLKKTRLTFFCKSAWPQYPLEGGKQWPVEGSLNYNAVLQLDLFCGKQGNV